MPYNAEYQKWLNFPGLSDDDRDQLLSIKNDPAQIKDCFFARLQFGTAGIRGTMGAGLARINSYTIKQATQGLALLILEDCPAGKDRAVVIAMDCRNNSDEFAKQAAQVLAANNIQVYLFDALRPTPELSFAIMHLNCVAGINITASHNPKEYNGYKAYWFDGAQISPERAEQVSAFIDQTDIFTGAKSIDFDQAVQSGIIKIVGAEIDKVYMEKVLEQCINKAETEKSDIKIVFTPFHGCGYKMVPQALKAIGIKNLICVEEQMTIDGNFPTLASPNPENPEGFALALELAKKHGANLIIATDPDADRVGAMVCKDDGEFVNISGNQMGALLLDYLIKARKQTNTLPKRPAAIKTIVSTEMVYAIGKAHDLRVADAFTGFKYIAQAVEQLAQEGFEYLLGFEESYGYLAGNYCKDKDAVLASALIAEMAAYYGNRGMTLYNALEQIYKEYGYYSEKTINIVMPGVDGMLKMQQIMENLRKNPPKSVGDCRVAAVYDYLPGTVSKNGALEPMELSGSDVLSYAMCDGVKFIIRPSGTEPKIKIYILAKGETREQCEARVGMYSNAANAMFE